MALGEKEQIEKIFCLFHQKNDCDCINPVTDEKTLVSRLEHHIRLNDILIKNTSSAEELSKLQNKNEDYRRRLKDLRGKAAAS